MRWLLLVLVASCGDDDSGTDAARDMGMPDVRSDRGMEDVATDVPSDVSRDAETDPDAVPDAEPDATPDAESDAMPTACTCNGGCGVNERCMQSQFGGLTPEGVECDRAIGLAECRPLCGAGCDGDRPYCKEIPLSAGCCSDAGDIAEVCCANDDATSVEDCL